MNDLLARLERLYRLELTILEHLESPLLLAIRLYWGWQFFVTGKAHLQHLDKTTDFFASLGIPFPRLNVFMAGSTEMLGGLLLLVGLGGRVVTIPLIFTMIVAFATGDHDNLVQVWSDPDKVVTAAPFLFLLASAIVLVFGPGDFSADALIAEGWAKRTSEQKTESPPKKLLLVGYGLMASFFVTALLEPRLFDEAGLLATSHKIWSAARVGTFVAGLAISVFANEKRTRLAAR